MFATIGGNVGPYVDVDLHTPDPELTLAPGLNLGKPGSKLNLTPSGVELNLGSGGTDIDISDLSSICLLSVDPKSEAEQVLATSLKNEVKKYLDLSLMHFSIFPK